MTALTEPISTSAAAGVLLSESIITDGLPGWLAQAVFVISYVALPAEFAGIFTDEPERVVKNWYMFFCVAVGLWGGLVIGIVTEYFTSNRYQPVQARARQRPFSLLLGLLSDLMRAC